MNENTFSYTYSAHENQEVLNIRKKYLPQEETKLEELKRLDDTVQNSGVMGSLCAGIGGILIFGLGLCLAMQVIGADVFHIMLGIALGVAGMIGMIGAYPVYRKTPGRILEPFPAAKIWAAGDRRKFCVIDKV